jgi:hypothetical protein
MKETRFNLLATASMDDVYTLLEGQVFHATSFANFAQIKADGKIRPNKDGKFSTPFGNRKNGYFQKRGCVSLFDYRVKPPESSINYRWRCSPFLPAQSGGDGAALLILSERVYPRLLPWNSWSVEEAWKDMLVPHVEAGHKGPIAFTSVIEVILVELLEDSDSSASASASAVRDTEHVPAATRRS